MAAKPSSSLPSFGSLPDLVFFSYARADRARVEPVAAALRARGASVWYDAGLAAGSSVYVESVRRALQRTGVMLVFVSAASVNSAWVTDELRAYRSLMARDPGHKLLAIHLDKTRLPLSLADVASVDARGLTAEDTVSLIASATNSPSLASAQPHPAATLQPKPVSSVSPAAEAAPVVAAPAAEAPAAVVTPLVETLTAETMPAMKTVAPVEAPTPVAEAPAATPSPPALPLAQVAKPAITPPPAEKMEWNRAVGPAVLLIALLIFLLFVLWVHAGYPLPAGWGQ